MVLCSFITLTFFRMSPALHIIQWVYYVLSIPLCHLIQRTAPAQERLEQTYTEKLAEATRVCNGCFLTEKSSPKNGSPLFRKQHHTIFWE